MPTPEEIGKTLNPGEKAFLSFMRFHYMKKALKSNGKHLYPFLNFRYLAKKLHRSPSAIHWALQGGSEVLRKRIERHLDWLEKKHGN